jgi:dihydrofolate synthase/folylpolyglutamate synthase
VLARWLASHPTRGRTIAVFGALGDKDVRGIVEPLAGVIDAWQLAGLANDSPRGLASNALGELVQGVGIAGAHEDVATALAAAFKGASRDDRIVAFGSFFIAAAALTFAQSQCR